MCVRACVCVSVCVCAGHGTQSGSSDRGALIIYTSGTTGRPKGALHTHRCGVRVCEYVCTCVCALWAYVPCCTISCARWPALNTCSCVCLCVCVYVCVYDLSVCVSVCATPTRS